MIRDQLKAALVTAMKSGDKPRTAAIRLIQSAIKNRDIELRTSDKAPDDDALVTEVMQKMIKQRRESIAMYETGATSPKDMGRVMALLKERHASQLDMSKASGLVKARLS